MKHLKVMILLFLAGLPLSLMAQVSEINGVVKDGAGEPLIGVSVIVKGSKVGTATDVDGHFSLKADKDKATLIFSFVFSIFCCFFDILNVFFSPFTSNIHFLHFFNPLFSYSDIPTQ
mgnify:CR=1 FL=1